MKNYEVMIGREYNEKFNVTANSAEQALEVANSLFDKIVIDPTKMIPTGDAIAEVVTKEEGTEEK